MASSGAARSTAFILSVLNLLLYFIITIAAAWAVKHGIERSHETASVLTVPARIFPIYFPIGNMATGFFLVFALLAGVVGMATSAMGVQDISQGTSSNLHSAASFSLITLFLSLLAMGLACKEIQIGWTGSNLRTLETITIIATTVQLISTGAIHAGILEADAKHLHGGGRV